MLSLSIKVWPQRLWGKERCANCRLTLNDFETNLKEEHATTMREYEQLIAGSIISSENSDQLQARNSNVKRLVANFRKLDLMTYLSEIAAEIP
uniref:Uncharacterized protein n=1 Tax=Parascaris univalens TaxID=6257 RepID=A0A915A3P1_PARUN